LVVATTGGRNTRELRERFPQPNVVIEDYVDFGVLMPAAQLFIGNGGAGSVMHALVHGVPVVTAGKLEGKNDINVRLAARGLSVDLGTERPRPAAIAQAVRRVTEGAYPQRAASLRDELARYDSPAIIERALVRADA
jgi:UDP:flavonoid glycosyltransferase YjiC (YdhE family)